MWLIAMLLALLAVADTSSNFSANDAAFEATNRASVGSYELAPTLQNGTGHPMPRSRRRNVTKSVHTRRESENIKKMQKLKPTNASLNGLRDVISRIGAKSEVIVVTSATYTYRELVFNWIKHLEDLSLRNYIILCFDERMFRFIGPEHGVLMANAEANYTDSDGSVTRTERAKKGRIDLLKKERMREFEEKMKRARENAGVAGKGGQEEEVEEEKEEEEKRGKRLLLSSSEKRSSVRARVLEAREPREKSAENKAERTSAKKARMTKVKATSVHFTSYQLAKFEALHLVVSLGKTAVWSDTDAVWRMNCAYSRLLELPRRVDVAGQRALFPTTLSAITGSCLCSGFFMLRPWSTAVLTFLDQVRKMLLANEDDQSAVNKALMSLGAFGYGQETVVLPSGRTERRKKKTSYNSTSVTTTPLKARSTNATSKNTGANRTLVLALLPYHEFPRGKVVAPVTQGMTREQRLEWHNTVSRNSTIRALWRNRTVHPVESPLHEQAVEWRLHKHAACLWHVISDKDGRIKVATMKRDGVFKLTPEYGWPYDTGGNVSEYSQEQVQSFLFPSSAA
jgi:hypothetical protein